MQLRWGMVGMMAGLVALPLFAQQDRISVGSRFGGWTVACEAVGVGETVCVLSQRLMRSADGAVLADLLAVPGGADTVLLAARVPLGVHLPSGLAMAPAGSDTQVALEWQACTAAFCEAAVRLDAETVAAIEAAGQMRVGYRPRLGAEPLVFAAEAAGLAEGIAALRLAQPPRE